MASQYSELKQTGNLSENQKQAQMESNSNWYLFIGAVVLALVIIVISAWFFCNNNIYRGDKEWVISHDVVGTYGDFIGGILGTLVALYSAYLLVKTLGNQLSINSDVMDTNKNIIKTNNTTIYQSFLQIFDNKFSTLFENYKQAKQTYQCDKISPNKISIMGNGVSSEVVMQEQKTLYGAEALEYIAYCFITCKYSDKRTYLSRVKSATNVFDEFYSDYRREMSVHFRNLYLLIKFIGETDNVDEKGNIRLTEDDRVEYAKSIRGQLSDGEMLLLRYNCLTNRGVKMQTFVNQFNLIKHLPVMSLLEFRCHRVLLRSARDASTLDTHFIELKKRIKEYIGFAANIQTSQWNFSVKYSISMELLTDKKQFKISVRRMKNRPATGSDGTPPIEKALNCFSSIVELRELYKDFIREALIVSNFYLYNGKGNTSVNGYEYNDIDYDYAVVEYNSQYPISVSS